MPQVSKPNVDDCLVVLTCVGAGSLKPSSKLENQADGDRQAMELPLAKLSGTFTKIRLSLPLDDMNPKRLDNAVLRRRLMGLLTGHGVPKPAQSPQTVAPKVQYRMHEALCAELLENVYEESTMRSHDKSSNPSEFQCNLVEKVMPLDFIVGNEAYRLTSYLHFIDAADGEPRGERGGSSWNDEEVEVINALVLQAIKKGVDRKSIADMTGYADQYMKLTTKAEANG